MRMYIKVKHDEHIKHKREMKLRLLSKFIDWDIYRVVQDLEDLNFQYFKILLESTVVQMIELVSRVSILDLLIPFLLIQIFIIILTCKNADCNSQN